MYSYEDRFRAVRLYIKLGKRLAATIRRLGYPTKSSLRSWQRDCRNRYADSLASHYHLGLELLAIAVPTTTLWE
jgi:transposase-like protein